MIMIYFVACYSTNLQEDPLSSIVENSPYINDGGTFKDFLMQSTDHVLSLKSKLGDTSPSSIKTFNVDEYGAQGDGKTDDTQVYIVILTNLNMVDLDREMNFVRPFCDNSLYINYFYYLFQ